VANPRPLEVGAVEEPRRGNEALSVVERWSLGENGRVDGKLGPGDGQREMTCALFSS